LNVRVTECVGPQVTSPRLLSWVCALAVAAFTFGPAQAQQQEPVLDTTSPAAAPTSAWGTQCVAESRSATLDCSAFQRGITQSGQLVGSVTIRIPPDTGKPVIVISAPLGVYLPAGITYSVDTGAPETLQIQGCDQNGCFANQPVTSDTLDAMAKGQKLNISFSNLNKQPITLPLSLVGFSAAYQRIK